MSYMSHNYKKKKKLNVYFFLYQQYKELYIYTLQFISILKNAITMVIKCAVKDCTSSRGKTQTSFHRFPRNPPTSDKWRIACGNTSIINKSVEELSASSAVCGLHFPKEHKVKDGRGGSLKQKHIVPTLNLPKPLSHIPPRKEGPKCPKFLTTPGLNHFSVPFASSVCIVKLLDPETNDTHEHSYSLPHDLLEEFQADDDTNSSTPQQLEDEQDPDIVDELQPSEADQHCRMCAEKRADMKQIFSMEAMKQNLPYKMKKYVNITVSEEDRLPLQVCLLCEAKLENCVTLAQSCADAQTFLNNLLAPPNTERLDSPVAPSLPSSPEMLSEDEAELPELVPVISDEKKEQSIEKPMDISEIPATKNDHIFVCKKCSLSCADGDDLEYHYLNIHQVYLCNKNCDLILNTWEELNQHIEQVHEQKLNLPIQDNSKNLVQSETEHKDKKTMEKKIYKCEICKKSFMKRYHLIYHLLMHQQTHPDIMKDLVCDICQCQFSSKQNLDVHFRRAHVRQWFYECRICNKKHYSVASIRKHVDTHKIVTLSRESKFYTKRSNFQCQICKKCFGNELIFRSHLFKHKKQEENK